MRREEDVNTSKAKPYKLGLHILCALYGWRIFANLRASLFYNGLSNEPNFGRIHLAGQYL